jgi:predicted ATPase
VAKLQTLFNLWTFSSAAADLTECANLVTRMSELAAGAENDEVALLSHCAGARTSLFRGKLAESADSVRRVFALYDPRRHSNLVNRTHNDEAGVSALGADGWRLWLQGFPAQAAARARAACELAERLDHPFSKAYALNWLIGTLQFRGETVELGRRISDVHSISAKHGFSLWSAWATFIAGWVAGARADVGDEADGIALMERGLDAWRGAGTHILVPYLLALLSETCLRAGRIDAAGERLAEARATPSAAR